MTVGIINDDVTKPVQKGNDDSGGVGNEIKFNPLLSPNNKRSDPNKI